MADEKIVTSIVANSDFSNLIADVQRVTNSLSRLQQEFAGANRSLAGQIDATNAMFSETMRKTGQFSTHFVSLTSDVEKFGRNLDSGRLKLRDYFRTYQEHVRTNGGLVRDLAKQQVQMQNAVLQPLGRNAQGLMQYNVHIPRGLDLTKNRAALLKQELQIMNKVIQDGGVQLINWGKNTQWAGRQLTVGLTLPLAAFGKAAADAFKVADQELTRLTKVYGDIAGTSAQELGKIRNEVSATAKELASAMGVNFAETIGLAADIAATGKTGNELLSSVSETTRLAVLGEVDRQEAMKATLAIQSAFKSNTQELAETINFLNAVENQTSTTLNDLVEAIPKAGPVIKGLGGSVQDLALYLTAMREGGVNASEGANALKSALASLINPTDVAVDKFKGFGIDLLGIVKNNAGDVTATLLALQTALDRLDPLSKQQAIEQLFGKFQFSRLNALFENLGRQGSQTLQVLDLMKASAGELEAVAGRELAAVTESASGRYRRAVEGLKAELAGVGDEFLDIGTKLINVLSKIIDFTQKLPDPIKKIMAFGGAFTAIIGPVIMLTGVLANFFGYIIKGLGHFKAMFKGAEGFKLLTPELMAARAASAQLSDEFYSDAAAAKTLSLAIEKLNADLSLLQKNAISVANVGTGAGRAVTTVGGAPIMSMGGSRVVDPTHPLLGTESRAAAHLNPRDPNNPSTIFGLTMQPIPLNRKLGRTPQIMMNDRMPNIEGLTSVGGYSTGVVAGEHARYAALMATLGVQSRQEIEQLKKTIALGGQVSSEFIATFDDILPITQRLTQNAATQSAAIVADLRAGKLNVEQARASIIAVNAQLEREMGMQITQYAAGRGRTIDLTKAPLIDQPVVDVSGKPNLRGMFRQGAFLDVMTAVGRATRTRTIGGPYSIETTKPQGLNAGGQVYMSSGAMVPGPNINADVVPAMLTPGEFVVNREATSANLPLLMAINGGKGAGGPGFNGGGFLPAKMLWQSSKTNMILAHPSQAARRRSLGLPPGTTIPGNIFAQDFINLSKQGVHPAGLVYDVGLRLGYGTKEMQSSLNSMNDEIISTLSKAGEISSQDYDRIVSQVMDKHLSKITRNSPALGRRVSLSEEIAQLGFERNQSNRGMAAGSLRQMGFDGQRIPQPLISTGGGLPPTMAESHWSRMQELFPESQRRQSPQFGRGRTMTSMFGAQRGHVGASAIFRAMSRGRMRFNRGGMVPGYQLGGRIPGGGGLLTSLLLGSLGSMAGSTIGSRFGTGGSMLGGMLGYMIPDLLMGRSGRSGVTPAQRLGLPGPSPFGPTLAEQMGLTPSGPGMAIGGLGMRQSVFAGTRFAGGIANMAEGPSKFASIAGKALAGVTRLNVALAAGTTIVAGAYKAWQNYNETQRLSAAAFGLTAESAQKAGLKFTDYNAKVKDAIAAQKLMIDQNMLTYESLQSAGTPFKMTIAEYKKLRKELKETMAEQIKVINATSRPDAARVAVQLKEQLMAAGLSAEEAAKRIYTLFNLSNKAGQAVSVINTDAFRQIVDAQTAAASALQSFNYAKNFENTRDAAAALNTALTAINTGVDDLVSKSEKAARKKGQEFNETTARYEAEKKQLDIIANKVGAQEAIGQGVLNNLKKQNPEIEKFINKQDTAVSMFQKLRLVAMGFTGDLSKMNAEQADMIYKLQIATAQAVETVNKKGLLSKEYTELKRLGDLKKKYESAAKGQSVKEQIDTKERLKALDKEIKRINDRAEAKKKGLREEAQAEDVALRIQQQRLEYEKAVASGDFAGAASAQLDIQRTLNEQQVVLAEQQIEERRLKDIAPLERQREKIQNAQDDLANKASLAAESLDSINKKYDKQKEKIDEVNSSMTALQVALKLNKDNLEKFKQSEEFKGLAGDFVLALKGIGVNMPEYTYAGGGMPIKTDVGSFALDQLNKFGAGIDSILAQNDVTVTASGDIFIDGKKINDGKEGPKYTMENPYVISSGPKSKQYELNEKGTLSSKGGNEAIRDKNLQPGDVLEYKGIRYKVRQPEGNMDPKTWYTVAQKASGGLLRGPGTGTSDSILGMYANGGMVRVSNGEYVVNADTVSKLGVPFFDRINGMKNGGLMLNYNVPKYNEGGPMVNTMPYNPSIGGAVYNVGNVTMQFAEAPANGKQLFEEFKIAMALDERKTGTQINMNRRYL